jgi:predicted transcriptional regulator
MTNQQVTIELPEPIVRQLTPIAEATQQSVELRASFLLDCTLL